MNLQVAEHQTEGYRINTELYEGPLDLLLELIERAELDITKLALAQVTDQYLEHMNNMQDRNAAEVSAFLVIAARLVQIKSTALLPRPAVQAQTPGEEDPGEALAQLLIQYRRFKQIANWLEERHISGLHTYLRLDVPTPKIEGKLDLNGLTLTDLVQVAYEVFNNKSNLRALNTVVNIPRVTIREKIGYVMEILQRAGKSSFSKMLKNKSRVEIVVTFLALLELVKRHIVDAQQTALFEDIQFETLGNWEEKDEGELDFQE
ncbi:MAG TPA: segregation/condensation protein A [Anaerolineaceae bacterium]|nr:segregation/condensation protein A [Anaerolineaceae bacterium]